MGDEGPNKLLKTAGNQPVSSFVVTPAVTLNEVIDDQGLALIIRAWPDLTNDVRRQLVAIIKGGFVKHG